MKEPISKNFYKGEPITDPYELLILANEKKSIYTYIWGIKPAAVLLFMQFRVVMQLIKDKRIYSIRKSKTE
jgi:hypothetical protein